MSFASCAMEAHGQGFVFLEKRLCRELGEHPGSFFLRHVCCDWVNRVPVVHHDGGDRAIVANGHKHPARRLVGLNLGAKVNEQGT
jgi:hypothetical protein